MSAKRSISFLAVLACLFGGLSTSEAVTRYVSLDGTNDAANGYNTWAGAATNIQSAVDVSSASDLVLVSNGTYTVTASINMTTPTAPTVRSLNGADVTIVDGNNSVRCFVIYYGILDGFTIINGFTPADGGGGMVLSGTRGAYPCIAQNCVIRNNSAPGAYNYGGGVSMAGGALLLNSTIASNSATAGGGGIFLLGYGATVVSNCQIIANTTSGSGGGILSDPQYNGNYGNVPVTVYNCVIAANKAASLGAGLATAPGTSAYAVAPANGLIAKNCLICNNTNSGNYGGGVFLGNYNGTTTGAQWQADVLINCTIAGNKAGTYGGGVCSGPQTTAQGGSILNCLIYSNSTVAGDAYSEVFNSIDTYTNNYAYTCLRPTSGANTLPAPNQGNIGSDPRFVSQAAGNYRISYNSPCINKGTNEVWMDGAFDLDTNARIRFVTVDMGAYEATSTNIVTHYVSLSGGHVSPFTNGWGSAATDIQSAVDVAQPWDEVLVNDGTYTLTSQITVNKRITLKSVNGTNATFINGNYPNTTNRCFDLSGGATLDGFTISNGFFLGTAANDGGGGIQMSGSYVYNCVIIGNACSNQNGDVMGGGGGVRMKSGIISNCAVMGNTVRPNSGNFGDSGCGGGINTYTSDGSVLIVASRISGNTAKYGGGGIVAYANAYPAPYPQTVVNCLVDGNSISAPWGVGGGLYGGNGSVVQDCVISNNTASSTGDFGGGVFLSSGSRIYGSTIIANTGYYGGGVRLIGYGPTAMSNCQVIANTSINSGGGVLADAQYNGQYGNVTITIDNCTIAANRAAVYGGGLQTTVGGNNYPTNPAKSVIIRNCLICNNTNTGSYGGGVYLANYYPGVYLGAPWQADEMINCTIAGNRAGTLGGGVSCVNETNNGSILNCIIYSNTCGDAYEEVYNAAAIATNIYAYNCIRPTPAAPDTVPAPNQGNIAGDPAYVNPGASNYRLRGNSPCLGAGTNVYSAGALDLDGKPRVRNGLVDMGAYENVIAGTTIRFF